MKSSSSSARNIMWTGSWTRFMLMKQSEKWKFFMYVWFCIGFPPYRKSLARSWIVGQHPKSNHRLCDFLKVLFVINCKISQKCDDISIVGFIIITMNENAIWMVWLVARYQISNMSFWKLLSDGLGVQVLIYLLPCCSIFKLSSALLHAKPKMYVFKKRTVYMDILCYA